MTWIQTYSGRRFSLTEPSAEDVDIDDVAHALSLLCRFTSDAPPLEVPASEGPANRVPGLPRPIEPEDVRVGMLVERRKGEVAYRDRVQRIDGGGFISSDPTLPYMWMPGLADNGWSLWLIEDAPAPDPDREAVEAIREASWSIPPLHAAAAKPDPLPGLPESRDLLTSLRARGWDLVKRDLARAEQ